jgi:hypothetical protein
MVPRFSVSPALMLVINGAVQVRFNGMDEPVGDVTDNDLTSKQ